MRVVLIANPRSGRGRALPLRDGAARALVERGHTVTTAEVGPGVVGAMANAEAAVVFGGDGTIHGLLPVLRGSGAAVYHAPLGTENLFAREFRTRREAAHIVRAVERGEARTIDLGCIGEGAGARAFAIMLSIGPDAGVIHRLHAARRGAITHAAYVWPVFMEVLRPTLPRLTIEVNGREIARDERGVLVVANMRQYGLRVDPAVSADPADGLLDVVFMPCTTGLGAMARTAAARMRRHGERVIRVTAATIRVRSEDRTAAQADGEVLPWGATGLDVMVRVDPRALRVLVAGLD